MGPPDFFHVTFPLFFFCRFLIYLFLVELGLHRCMGFSLVAAASGSCSLVVVLGFPVSVASLAVEQGL